ncbi:MAG: TFIIB zinc-ribbon protein [Siphoviridae sp. ctvD11]|nr:MAG: TFIIB zinc-ribbon protein [Siphoviridae sp. ctvD11]
MVETPKQSADTLLRVEPKYKPDYCATCKSFLGWLAKDQPKHICQQCEKVSTEPNIKQ